MWRAAAICTSTAIPTKTMKRITVGLRCTTRSFVADFVVCNFPFRESRGPGPTPHTVLCLGAGHSRNVRFAIVFYTTSQIDYQGLRRPRQYLFVNETRAKQLHQRRAFHIDASRIARLPLTPEYFPQMTAGPLPVLGRDPDLVRKAEERLQALISGGIHVAKIDLIDHE